MLARPFELSTVAWTLNSSPDTSRTRRSRPIAFDLSRLASLTALLGLSSRTHVDASFQSTLTADTVEVSIVEQCLG